MSFDRRLVTALGLVGTMSGCSADDRPAKLAPVSFIDAGGAEDAPYLMDGPGGDIVAPPADAEGLCGNQFFQVVQEPPNIYFVLDRSGSMNAAVSPPAGTTKYTAVRVASVNILRELGNRARFGAAVFPGDPYADECGVGLEVFPTQLGDEPGTGEDGPVTKAFAAATNIEPVGGTPTAATLSALHETLSALPGKTAVILATDGGPNCNADVACSAHDCIWNIESSTLFGVPCEADYNCCSELLPNGPGNRGCLDAGPSVAAVQALRNAGIRTYVVGIPGSEMFVDLLNQLATVGGTARPDSPQYYRVDDVGTLESTLSQIGDLALVTCQFQLDQAPPDPDFVNVYLDGALIAYDEQNGWMWTSTTTLELRGEACDALERGEVAQVQVVAGCPTQQPR